MKRLIVLSIFLIALKVRAQPDSSSFSLVIKDSVITVKSDYKKAIKITVSINPPQDSLKQNILFYNFNHFVPSNSWVQEHTDFVMYKISLYGLYYFIEDSKGEIVGSKQHPIPSFKYLKDEITQDRRKIIVNKKNLKIKYVTLDSISASQFYLKDRIVFDKSNKIENIVVYPLLYSEHNLEKGEYSLYLFYSYNAKESHNIADQNNDGLFRDRKDYIIYSGEMRSNKIKLIVK